MNKEELAQAFQRARRYKPHLYLLDNYKIRGKDITFISKENPRGNRPWQIQILDDNHPYLVVRKSRQLGFSEVAIMKAIWFADFYKQTKGLFTFPTNRQMVDFVKTRLNPAINSSPYLQSVFDKRVDSVETKRLVNDSFLLFRSASSSSMGEGIDIDVLLMDEIDRMSPNVHLAFEESLKSSAFGWQRFWSTPTIPGNGIDKFFQDSDQRIWLNKCQHCGHWQFMTIEDNIIQTNAHGIDYITKEVKPNTFMYVCAKCKKWLDRNHKGEYVAKYPDRQGIRGYHISQLNADWISADRIKQNELRYESKQLFSNYVIGIPFAQEGLIINRADIVEAQRFERPILSRQSAEIKYQHVTVGIDWGTISYAIVLGRRPDGQFDILNMFSVTDNPMRPLVAVEDLARMIMPYNPDLIVADFGYGADRNAYLMQVFKNKAWACQFRLYKGASKPVDSWNEGQKLVSVDKTLHMQKLIHRIKEHSIGVWQMDEKLEQFAVQCQQARIMEEEDENTGLIYQKYVRLGGDHYVCGLCYAIIGMERLQNPFVQPNNFQFDFW